MLKNHLYLLILLILPLFSCSDDEQTPSASLQIPDSYTSENFDVNTNMESIILNDLSSLTNEIQKGRSGNQLTLVDLEAAYTDALEDITTDYYKNLITGNGNWLDNLAKASANTYTPGDTTGEGGVFGDYLFDENGLELEQMVEKGLFGAALYYRASQILDSISSLEDVDRVLALFGSNPSFPNTDNANSTTFPDKFMAKYAARRDKNDGDGLYSQMKNEFIRLKAAIAGGAAFNEDKTDAKLNIQRIWEEINAATVINYCLSVQSKMSATSPTDTDKASALHAYGEAVGFIHGWKEVPQSSKIITDTQIDEVLVLLNTPANQNPKSYLFITQPAQYLGNLQSIVDQLQTIYGFNESQIDDFSKNWVNEQNR